MTKQILTLLLCLILAAGLVACGGSEEPADTTTSAGTDSEAGSSGSSEEEKVLQGYDDSIDHLFFATDVKNSSIVMFDLDLCDGDFQSLEDAIVWEWKITDDSKYAGSFPSQLDSAKLRYSPYYEKNVVLTTCSGGWCAVIDYETKKILWQERMTMGSPHSIEMMPNGDVVVGCSGDEKTGSVHYIPLSAGETKASSTLLSSGCHGVSYDPVNEWLWILDDDEVYACAVDDPGTADAHLKKISGTGDVFDGDDGGHVLSPVYGEPGKYWVSAHRYLWQFDSKTETLTKKFSNSGTLSLSNIKGIASFSDGTMVQIAVGYGKETTDWSSPCLRILTKKLSTGKVQRLQIKEEAVIFTDREFYKVFPVNTDYQ